ncbi:MAG: 3-deoxy-manno-octulosonate cytidylyltransferase [Gemmatimonadetes bacterium]|nr:3-deoxy-manno-octulosonate cytidylyltransferase [Gemmatimonadota bacterium]
MASGKTKITGLIPARYASTRFPGKALATLLGKPMIQHTFERARRARRLTDLYVVTDDERIADVVRRFGGEPIMTSRDHPSGTDRLAEAVRDLDSDVVVNIQGDEPLITPEAIDTVVQALLDDPDVPMSTLAHRITRPEDLLNPHMGKVVFDRQGRALYFSRSPLPWPGENIDGNCLRRTRYYNTVGLYGYRRAFLLAFAALEPTPLECAERLEQLRALEHGYRIMVKETDYAPLGVDVPEDLEKAQRRLAAEEGNS